MFEDLRNDSNWFLKVGFMINRDPDLQHDSQNHNARIHFELGINEMFEIGSIMFPKHI